MLLFLTGPLSDLPNAVLAAVVFLIAARLVDVAGFRELWRRRRIEFWVAFVTAATVVFVGVQQGILLAMALSVVVHLRHSYRPANMLLARDGLGQWRPHSVVSGAHAAPGVIVYRFGGDLYYANAGRLHEDLLDLAASYPPPQRIVHRGRRDLRRRLHRLRPARRGAQELAGARCHARALPAAGPRSPPAAPRRAADAIGPDHIYDQIDDAVAGRTTPLAPPFGAPPDHSADRPDRSTARRACAER